MAERDGSDRAARGTRPSRSAVVTPRTVGAVVGAACLVALALAVVEAGGPAAGSIPPNPLGLGVMALGLVVLGAGLALRLRGPSPGPPARGGMLTLDEADVRALLARWYPDWEPRYRRRVAAAIAYHRRRMEAG